MEGGVGRSSGVGGKGGEREEGGRGSSLCLYRGVGGEGGGVLGWGGGERQRGEGRGDGKGGRGHARSIKRRHRLDSPLEYEGGLVEHCLR